MKEIILKTILPDEPLYHYTKINGIQGILNDREFFATNGNFLNDRNEMIYTLQILREVIEELEHPELKQLLQEQYPKLEAELKETDFFVISFSTDPDSITLWSEFGDRTGYNLEFNSRELLDRIGQQRKVKYHGYMIYTIAEQKTILKNLLMKYVPESLPAEIQEVILQHEGPLFRRYMTQLRKVISVYAIFFKQPEFAAEQEYRVVFREQSPDEICFRAKDGFLIPYITIPLGSGFRHIRRITVAPKNHVDLAETGMRIYARHLGYHAEVGLSRIQLRY